MPGPRPHVLVLGGTGEAAALASALARRRPEARLTVSLAGRAGVPSDLPGRVRVGGFGGAEGLAAWLESEGVAAVIDATHPFATRISANARRACAAGGVPRIQLVRPAWEPAQGDRWVMVADAAEAAARLPALGRRAFLTIGGTGLGAFAACAEAWFLVRLAVPPATPPPLPRHRLIVARGPFAAADDEALMREHAIEVLVTKASGGTATAGKLAAARRLGLPVLMLRRPPPEPGPRAATPEEALRWLDGVLPPPG